MDDLQRSKKRSYAEISQVAQLTEQIKDTVKKIEQKIKKQRLSSNERKELSTLFKDGFMLFLDLKQANRAVHEVTYNTSEETRKYREKLNVLNLELQNLQYEKNHYLREIQSCRNFPSVIDTIGLISQEEFFTTAPRESLPNSTEVDLHVVMLKRLEYELKQRTELQETLKELKTRLKLLLDDNSRRESFLGGLQNKLQDFTEASKPIQQYISLSINSEQQQKEIAQRLPKPLYFLYTHIYVFKEATNDDSISVDIQGEFKKEEFQVDVRQNDREKSISIQEAYESHSLNVLLILTCKRGEQSIKLHLRFLYLVHLNIVTLLVSSPSGPYEDVLIGLFPNDMGNDTPNLANYYTVQDKNFRFSPKVKGRPFLWVQHLCGLEFLPRKADNEGPTLDEISERKSENLTLNLRGIFTAIQHRVSSAQSLQSQLEQLAKGKIPVEIKASIPVRSLTSLDSWSEVDADSYHRRRSRRRSSRPVPVSSNASTKEEGEVEEGEVETDNNTEQTQTSPPQTVTAEPSEDAQRKESQLDFNRYFRAIFEYEKDTYKARILVSPCYPHIAPVFKLSMKSHKNKHVIPSHIKIDCDPDAFSVATKSNSSHREDINLKHIQAELNLNFKSLLPSDREMDRLLSYQLKRLKLCLDVLCEITKKGNESASAKIMGRPFRGRDRRIILL